jgi:hypothetical protein
MHGRGRIGIAVGVALAIGCTSPAYAAKAPTSSQVRSAIRKAERSRDLWATVNICNSRRHPNVMGIRGQMPSLGFKANLAMKFAVDFWVISKHEFRPVPHVGESVSVGTSRLGLRQGGVRFKFSAHAGHLRGSVTFLWRLGHRVIGSVTRKTSGGHHSADFGDPPRYSSSQCWLT